MCQYRKNGETKTKARANLKAFFVEHTGTFGDGALAPDDTVQDLLDFWFQKMEKTEGGPGSETLGHYRSHVRWVLAIFKASPK
ncbi:MAG: Integrase [Aeromicrobium sp.]|nr:Integrase [Aeromicrobium sp.]